MAGGIQIGSTTWDTYSRALERTIRDAAEVVYLSRRALNLTIQRKLTKSQIPYGIGALSPDGYCWFLDGKLVLVVEAKKQNNRGNAIERWYKNNYIARVVNPEVTYLTFASGDGAAENGVIYNTLYIAHEGDYNKVRPRKNSAFLSVDGFTVDTAQAIINETLTRLGA
jgi:hypothetical protein